MCARRRTEWHIQIGHTPHRAHRVCLAFSTHSVKQSIKTNYSSRVHYICSTSLSRLLTHLYRMSTASNQIVYILWRGQIHRRSASVRERRVHKHTCILLSFVHFPIRFLFILFLGLNKHPSNRLCRTLLLLSHFNAAQHSRNIVKNCFDTAANRRLLFSKVLCAAEAADCKTPHRTRTVCRECRNRE